MVNQNGKSSEAHFCADCAGQYAGQYQQMLGDMFPFAQSGPFGSFTPFGGMAGLPVGSLFAGMQPVFGWVQPVQSAPAIGTPQPAQESVQGDPEFQKRRELGLLREKMRNAAAAEDFEQAAKLRDEIKKLEQDGSTDAPS